MKTNIIAISCLCLSIGIFSSPANAQVFGPRGGSFSRNRVVRTNRDGGTTRFGTRNFSGPNGGASVGAYGVRTDGQGNVIYGRGRVTTGPNGNTRTVRQGGSFNPETGYAGQGTRTVNGQTYSTRTENGAFTVTGPEGNSRTFYRPY